MMASLVDVGGTTFHLLLEPDPVAQKMAYESYPGHPNARRSRAIDLDARAPAHT